ncbi:MAG: citrate/2-methylcitrate synthase [Desulfobacterales bacterium]|nr:citrate/2-methylcitrate synthase [Desulfobacterales bacterium]
MAALWGPLHGGANQAVIEMLDRVAPGKGQRQPRISWPGPRTKTTPSG